ncbi:MAG: pilus assembly protein PilM [Planctomycetota bacterium]
MRNQMALGIDISHRQISMALLRRDKNGVQVLKAGNAPVPDGTIRDGCIEEPEVLAKAIKELKSHNNIRAKKAAISLSTESTIVHILDAPKGAPSNIGQFVQNEFKSYVALSGRKIAFDYCGIKSGQGVANRLLAVAADRDELAMLNMTCRRAHLDVEAIEPPILGYIRALFAERIEGRFESDVLIAVLYGCILTLCVFRKQTLDFLRIEANSGENTGPGELCRGLADELNTIIQYYDVEVADSSGKWEVTIVADGVQLPDDAEASLKSMIESDDLEVRTGQNACRDTIVDYNNCKGQPSTLAIGLAMGLLDVQRTGLKVNLVPPESAEVKAVKKQLALTIAAIAVAVPLLMLAVGAGFNRMADKTKNNIVQSVQAEMSQDMQTLFNEKQFLERQIELLSKRPGELNDILGSRPNLDWAKILDDIRNHTPEAVRITAMQSTGNAEIILEGMALSYEAIRLFVKTLNESDYINAASLTETTKTEESGGLVMYKIDCALVIEESKS